MRSGTRRVRFRGAEVDAEDAADYARCQAALPDKHRNRRTTLKYVSVTGNYHNLSRFEIAGSIKGDVNKKTSPSAGS